MISERYSPEEFLRAVLNCDLLRLQAVAEEELRVVDLTCRRAWNQGDSVPPTAPRYLNFLRRLCAWLEAGGDARVRLSSELREPWRKLVCRLVETGQLGPRALRCLGRNRAHALPGRNTRPFAGSPESRSPDSRRELAGPVGQYSA